jgi:alpha-glucosidase
VIKYYSIASGCFPAINKLPGYMKKKMLLFLVTLCMFSIFQAEGADTTIVLSPDGRITFRLFQNAQFLSFNISRSGSKIIETSRMEMSLDGTTITKNVSVIKVERYRINETYPWSGVHSSAHNNCNSAKIFIKGKNNFYIDLRVFNDGAAFRTIIPGRENEKRIPGETTVFNLPSKSTAWYHDLNMHYESIHVKKLVDSIPEGTWLAPPATFKLSRGTYAAITEAALVKYSGMALQANGKNGMVLRLANDQPTSYPYRLRYSAEDTLRMLQPAVITGTITTPWRVVIIGNDLNTMVNSDIVTNLNPAPNPKLFPKGIHTEWIKPGRAVWKYLNGGGDGTVEIMKHFTDGAASLGFEHNILEGFWSRWTNEQIKDLVDYSKQKGVGIWLWKHSKSLRNPASRDSFFSRCHDLGITGIKVDFFDSEAKEVIDLYEDILKESAKYHLLCDFHGANKPTGLARTYPNEMVREAVKGMETSKIVDRATHETKIHFTRLLEGPAEYTVVHFGERRKNTTWAHQIASAAILAAPLLTYAANPDSIPAETRDMIKSIPATWDETIVLTPSAIGEVAVFARRNGSTWFLAVMNGVGERKIKIPLSFLKGNYKTLILKDDPSKSAGVIINDGNFSGKDNFEIELVSGGGFIARFIK